MTVYAVVDTNVLVSSLLTSNSESPTVRIIELIREQKLIPLYSEYLLSEYREVLRRGKFALPVDVCEGIVTLFTRYGRHFEPSGITPNLPDPDDAPIFLITMETRDLDSYLVTGNIRHYPLLDYVVTPNQMLSIISEIDSGKSSTKENRNERVRLHLLIFNNPIEGVIDIGF